MKKKNMIFYGTILILALLVLWLWVSNENSASQINLLQNYNSQLSKLSGIGPLKSTHIHADIKVYIDGNTIDFSQKKYQVTTSYIHFEDGIGDVVHMHATGLTMSHLFKSLNGDFSPDCLTLEGQSYCNSGNNTQENQRFSGPRNSERISRELKFYVNGKPNNEFSNYVFKDLDKILVSYGSENQSEIQKQLDSITNLAPKLSGNKQEME